MVDPVLVYIVPSVIFCSHVQFLEWYNELPRITEKEDVADEKHAKTTKVVEQDIFSFEKVPWKLMRDKGNYNTDPRKLKVSSHMSMDEIAVHCYRNELNISENVEKIV